MDRKIVCCRNNNRIHQFHATENEFFDKSTLKIIDYKL